MIAQSSLERGWPMFSMVKVPVCVDPAGICVQESSPWAVRSGSISSSVLKCQRAPIVEVWWLSQAIICQ